MDSGRQTSIIDQHCLLLLLTIDFFEIVYFAGEYIFIYVHECC